MNTTYLHPSNVSVNVANLLRVGVARERREGALPALAIASEANSEGLVLA